MNNELNRRQLLAQSGACLAAGAGSVLACGAPAAAETPSARSNEEPFLYCLNMGTVIGYKLSIAEEIEVAAKAGYQGVEVWTRNLRRCVESGDSLGDVKKRIDDLGLTVVSAIGFPRWAVDDDKQRAEGLEVMKQDMDLLHQIGGRHIAAPPAGINRTPGVDLRAIADRYRRVLELGREMDVLPQLEIWGSALTLGTVAEAAFVALTADHPNACLLLDAYHVYRGGSGFECLRLLNGAAMHDFHINDYPADPPREELTDAHRLYPGDGVAPMDDILRDLYATGFRGALSLELFNRDYWQQDVAVVARTGLKKMQAAVRHAGLGARG